MLKLSPLKGESYMTMKACGYCGKENDESMPACASCGTPLGLQMASQNAVPASLAQKRMARGALALALGAAVTVGTYLMAGPGGTYWVAWGAMAWGAFQLILGLIDSRKPPEQVEREAELEKQFETAVLLDAAGRMDEAFAMYEDLANKHPDTKWGRDAKNTVASLHRNRGVLN
jgi:hypothetical protein